MSRAEVTARYRAANRDKRRSYDRDRRQKIKQEVFERYGSQCATCGFDNPLALVLDHIDDNGAEERLALGAREYAGCNFYRHLKKSGWPDGYQILCANCNMIKQQMKVLADRL